MLYGKRNVSIRTILNLAVAVVLLAFGAGTALAAGNTGVAPQLVPYTVSLLAGNAQSTVGGYGGDGQKGSAATLNTPQVLAVDAVGNVYFADQSNSVIREVNAQTGIVNTVAGIPPTKCSGVTCTAVSGCADGVPAYKNGVGASINGIAVDGFGNVIFSDANTGTVSVIYRGGTHMANFITLENPGGVKTSNGLQPGYVYHVAGTINLATCAGTLTKAASSTAAAVPAGDGNMAFQGATFSSAQAVSLDSAGNIYVQDAGINGVMRVINTQTTTQTFFGFTVQPGAIQSILNCGPLTIACNTLSFASLTAANTGIGGPAGAAFFNTVQSGAGNAQVVDQYGNIYEINGKGATPGIYMGVAYAGGTALGNLINNAISGYNPKNATPTISGTLGLTATPGDFYYILQNITLRPASVWADLNGNVWYVDDHYGQLYRIDANAQPYASDFLEISSIFAPSRGGANVVPATASPTSPAFCNPATNSTTNPTLTGYTTTDILGDGCPANVATGIGSASAGNGYGSAITDGLGQVLIADHSHEAVRKISMNTAFPATAVGKTLQQTIQVHFDASNLPAQATMSPNVTTSSFTIGSGISDFTISPISSLYTAQSTPAVTGLPTCSNLTSSVDLSLDCIVNVIFSPTAPGIRQSQLVVTTANGSVYQFGLTGIGTGGQLAVDGGAQAVVPATGLGNTAGIAVTQSGTVYIADPANNRVVALPAGGGAQTTVGTGLSGPMGVAVDSTGNVYISDTGNNRIVKVAAVTGTQTTLGGIVAIGTPAYPAQYTFNKPQGLAVDVSGNVYVADTGNKQIVEIPSNPVLGGATPLLSYTGAAQLVNPVAVTVDKAGNIFFADSGLIQIFELPPGGGDLQNLPPTILPAFGGPFQSPNGVAVDAAGNVYVSDSTTNLVYEVPSATGPGAEQVALSFTGLNAPAGLALDASGNLYVADSGNSRVLFSNRANPLVPFGTVPQDAGAVTSQLTVTNIGTQAITLSSPFSQIGSVTPTGDAAFTVTDTCSSLNPAVLPPGLHCTVTPSFTPTSDGPQGATLSLQGGLAVAMLTANGEQPQVKIVLAVTSPSTGPVAGSPATVTATVTQPYFTSTPSGQISFTYTVDGVSGGAATLATLTPSGGNAATASLTLPTLLQGRVYVISASYLGDTSNSPTTATPYTFYIPGVPVTATSTSTSFNYGSAPPALTGTVTGVVDAGVTYKFVTPASATTPVGTYPINVVFSGTNAANYGYGPYPPVVTSSGSPATVTENPVPLTVTVGSFTSPYGAPNLNYGSGLTITGKVNKDGFTASYTPASSSILNVGTYSVVPTLAGPVGNYTLKVTNGSLTITAAPTAIGIGQLSTTVLPSALSTSTLQISVATQVTQGLGTPTGTVTLTDVFTPITAGAPGTSAPLAPVTIGPLTLVNGTVSYTPTSTALGTHVYSASYSGDSNFSPSTLASGATLLVDNADFTIVSTTTPIQIAPGVLPGGNASVAGEAAATPETATVTITSILNQASTVTLTCTPQNPSYVTCTLTPPTVTLAAGKTATSTVAISTPATLPLGFTFSSALRQNGSETVLAFLPLGVLAFCFRKRKKLSKALWILLAIAGMTAGMTGCGGNSVHFFTPVPQGAQTVTIFASATSITTNTVVTRSFTVPINIQ